MASIPDVGPAVIPAASQEGPFGDLPDDLRALVKAELDPGERLLWAAKSNPKHAASVSWKLLFFAPTFLLVGTGTLLVWSGPYGTKFSAIEPLMLSVAFLAIIVGFFMSVGILTSWLEGRFERRTLKKNLYALTDRRAITWVPQPGSTGVQVRTADRGSVERTSRIEYPDGSGDLYFEPDGDPFANKPALWGVPEVRRVEELARRVLIDPEKPTASPSQRGPR